MYFYSLIENLQLRIAAPKFEFGCGFYFCVIGALKYIIGSNILCTSRKRQYQPFM